MVSEVYYAHRRATMGGGLLEKTEQLFTVAGFARMINPQAQVAVKLTFPDRGNITHVRPQFIRRIVDQIAKAEGKPYLTDTVRLGNMDQRSGVDVLCNLQQKGFNFGSVHAPLVLADGLTGQDRVSMEGSGKYLQALAVPSSLYGADALIVVSHFTGHERLGFAGSLYNLGAGMLPQPDSKERGGSSNADAQATHMAYEIAEACAALARKKNGRCGFFNFLLEVTPDSDYGSGSDAPVVPDIGILASRDPVALDQASVDLFNHQPGIADTRLADSEAADKLRSMFPQVQWQWILEYAEELGLGSRSYELMVV